MDDAVAGIDRSGHRVDEERHVVVDDLDDRMRRRPAIRGRVRVVDPDLGLAGAPTLAKAPQRQGGSVEIAGRAFGDIRRRNVLVKLRNEPIGCRLICRVEQLTGQRRRLVDERRLLSVDSAHHRPFDPRHAWKYQAPGELITTAARYVRPGCETTPALSGTTISAYGGIIRRNCGRNILTLYQVVTKSSLFKPRGRSYFPNRERRRLAGAKCE